MGGKKDIVEQALKLVMGGAEGVVNSGIIPGTFPGSKMPSVDALSRNVDKFVYHSGTAKDIPDMKYGVEPQIGPWVREVLEGSADDDTVDEIMENAVPVSWWSKEPSWAVVKVARELGKPIDQVTPEDLASYGHVALIPKKDPEAESLYWVGEEGLNRGPYSDVEDITGRKVKAYDADLYSGNYGPEGVEKNEYITTRTVEPYLHLTGNELVDFLRKTGQYKKSSGGRTGYQTKGRVVGDAVDAAMRLIAGAEPQKTAKAYKLFKQREGKLYPLFVDANEEVPLNQWLKAKAGEQAASGKVRSKIGELAYRPGWHAGDLPIATHIGARSHGDPKLPPDTRPSDQVWAEVDMADDVDWQKIADERARMTKKGTPDPKTAHITDQVPYGGYYRYKTNPNMTGNWMIGGDMRVNRVLTDDEVKAINEAAGVSDLPRREGYAGRGRVVEKALKAVTDYFAPNTDEYAANLGKFYGSTDPALRKRFYTGTSKDKDFTAFQESRHGTWLTDSPEDASSYALSNDSMGYRPGPGWTYEKTNQASRVIPAYAKIENPYRGEKPDWVMKQDNYKKAQSDWFDQLRAQGYDAWVPDSGNGGLAVVLKGQGTNVKSAIGNQGTFDPTKKHMGKSEGGRTGYGPGGVIDDIVKMAGRIVSGADEPAKTGIRAYHSSPHDFDKFEWSPRTSMTGEGAQAYGAGLYFAENPSVSDRGGDYWRQFFNKMPSGPERSAAGSMFVNKFDRDLAAAQTERNLKYNEDRAIPGRYGDGPDIEEGHRLLADEERQALDMLQSGKIVGPRTYEVNINADPNTFLDWDKPLSEQPEAVKNMLARLPGAPDQSVWPYTTGNDLYEQLRVDAMGDDAFMQATPQRLAARKAAAPEVTRMLREAGIPGIKYLDAGSRGKGVAYVQPMYKGKPYSDPIPAHAWNQVDQLVNDYKAKGFDVEVQDLGTRNYVVFDDKLISIIRKYGIAGASAMLGYNLMEQLDPKQALAASMADQDYQSSRPQRSMGGNNSVSGALNVARGLRGGM